MNFWANFLLHVKMSWKKFLERERVANLTLLQITICTHQKNVAKKGANFAQSQHTHQNILAALKAKAEPKNKLFETSTKQKLPPLL